MSKKRNRNNQAAPSTPSSVSQDHALEYKIIKHDLIRLIILNVVVLAALLVLYYTNLRTPYLSNIASRLFHL